MNKLTICLSTNIWQMIYLHIYLADTVAHNQEPSIISDFSKQNWKFMKMMSRGTTDFQPGKLKFTSTTQKILKLKINENAEFFLWLMRLSKLLPFFADTGCWRMLFKVQTWFHYDNEVLLLLLEARKLNSLSLSLLVTQKFMLEMN